VRAVHNMLLKNFYDVNRCVHLGSQAFPTRRNPEDSCQKGVGATQWPLLDVLTDYSGYCSGQLARQGQNVVAERETHVICNQKRKRLPTHVQLNITYSFAM
jgi:hypothetical protein